MVSLMKSMMYEQGQNNPHGYPVSKNSLTLLFWCDEEGSDKYPESNSLHNVLSEDKNAIEQILHFNPSSKGQVIENIYLC